MKQHYVVNDSGAVISSNSPIPDTLQNAIINLPPNINLLDIGAGDGKIAKYIYENRPDINVHAIDSNQATVKEKRDKVFFRSYQVAEAHQLPFGNKFFQCAILINVLHEACTAMELQKRRSVLLSILKETKRVLSKNGTTIIFDGVNPLPSDLRLIIDVKTATGEKLLKTISKEFTGSGLSIKQISDSKFRADAHSLLAVMTKYKYLLHKHGWSGEKLQLYTFVELNNLNEELASAGFKDIKNSFAPNQVPINFLKHFNIFYEDNKPVTIDVLQQFRCLFEAKAR